MRRATLVAAYAVMLTGAATAAAETRAAKQADAFVDSIGVATHLTYGGTPYMNYPLVKQRLSESGIRHIRDGWGTGSAYASDFVRNELGPLGVKITMVHDPRNNASAAQQKEMVKNQLLPVIAAAESLNEWDTQGGGWASYARQWTIDLANAYRSDPATANVPILGPSMADTNNTSSHQAMGDLSPYVNFGNAHDYPGNQYQMTDQIVDTVLRNWGYAAPGKPVMVTETGFSSGTQDQPYPAMTDLQAQAISLPNIYLHHFSRGIVRTFSYEFIDQHPDGKFESNFGMLRNDGSPKPSFNAVKTMIGLLADRGAAFTPQSLQFTIEGGDANTRSLLLQKRDGSFWLVLWQGEKVWNGSQTLSVGAKAVTVRLNSPAQLARTYVLTSGATARAEVQNTSAVQLSVTPAASIIELRFGKVPRPPTDLRVTSLLREWLQVPM